MGITKYAADALGDIVHVDLPGEGDSFDKGDSIVSYSQLFRDFVHSYVQCAIESVKTAADVYMPCNGKITKVNEALEDEPQHISIAAEEDGWLMELEIEDTD